MYHFIPNVDAAERCLNVYKISLDSEVEFLSNRLLLLASWHVEKIAKFFAHVCQKSAIQNHFEVFLAFCKKKMVFLLIFSSS